MSKTLKKRSSKAKPDMSETATNETHKLQNGSDLTEMPSNESTKHILKETPVTAEPNVQSIEQKNISRSQIGSIEESSKKSIKQQPGSKNQPASILSLTTSSRSEEKQSADSTSPGISKLSQPAPIAEKAQSSSRPRRKPSLKRTRALKRHNIDFSPAAYWSQQGELFLTPDVSKYAWAACRRGAFEGKSGFDPRLDPTEFDQIWQERISQFVKAGGEVVVPTAKVRGELIPVGMITIAYQENRAYPHVIWFPEASARIRLEIGVKFIVELKKTHLVLITAETPDVHYFRHLSRYGLLKAVGKIQGYTATGDDVMMFQSAGT